MHMQWNYCDICKIFRIRTKLKWWVFKKISSTKNCKSGPFPSSSFTMIICTNSIHLLDSNRSIADVSNVVCSIFVGVLIAEELRSLYQVAARNFYWERRRQRQRVIPTSGARLPTSNSYSYMFSESMKRLIHKKRNANHSYFVNVLWRPNLAGLNQSRPIYVS